MSKYMSDQTRALFERELKVLDPAIEEFCVARGYVSTQRDLGTYPGRILRKADRLNRLIESMLWKKDDGENYDEFFAEIPFSFCWVASLEREKLVYRLDHLSIVPFSVLRANIRVLLDEADDSMSALQAEDLIRNGKVFDLNAPFRLKDYVY